MKKGQIRCREGGGNRWAFWQWHQLCSNPLEPQHRGRGQLVLEEVSVGSIVSCSCWFFTHWSTISKHWNQQRALSLPGSEALGPWHDHGRVSNAHSLRAQSFQFCFFRMYACVLVFMCTTDMQVPMETWRQHWNYESWRQRWVWAARCGNWTRVLCKSSMELSPQSLHLHLWSNSPKFSQ